VRSAATLVCKLSPAARTWLQIGAGLPHHHLGPGQLGFCPRIQPDRGRTTGPRGRGVRNEHDRRQHSNLPCLVVATVLLHCGVTCRWRALALAWDHSWQGAASWPSSSSGTSPLFAFSARRKQGRDPVQQPVRRRNRLAVIAMRPVVHPQRWLELAANRWRPARSSQEVSAPPTPRTPATTTVTDGKRSRDHRGVTGISHGSPRSTAASHDPIVRSDKCGPGLRSAPSSSAIPKPCCPNRGDTRHRPRHPSPGTCGRLRHGMYTGAIAAHVEGKPQMTAGAHVSEVEGMALRQMPAVIDDTLGSLPVSQPLRRPN